jgi:hypothetical protein
MRLPDGKLGKGIIDAFMGLVVEENLDTVFLQGASNVDKEAMAKILNDPIAYIGLSDGGAYAVPRRLWLQHAPTGRLGARPG